MLGPQPRIPGPSVCESFEWPFSLTQSGWEGQPRPCGLLACTVLTFVVKLLRLLVLVNWTHLTLISTSFHECPWNVFVVVVDF